MERIPEPELMEGAEQARAYSAADFSEPHDRFVAELRARVGGLAGRVLDLGCGPADVTVRLARAFPSCSFDGVDASDAMLAEGAKRVEAEDLGSRVRLTKAYLPNHAPPAPPYDAVVSNSLLHHLAEPDALWSSVERFAAPGARVFVMDLRRPASRDGAFALVEAHAGGEPEVLRADFFHSLLAAYTPGEIEAQLAARPALAGLQVEPIGDRHVIVFGSLTRAGSRPARG